MKPPGWKKIGGVVIAALIVIFAVYRVFLYRLPVAVVLVKKAQIRDIVEGPGTVQSKVPVALSARITGILEKLYADQGDRVKRGQVLADLDSAELRHREAAARWAQSRAQRDLARAKADLVKSQASLLLAQSNYQRDLEVFTPGYISAAAFDITKAALRVAQSDVAANEASVEASKAAISQAESDTRTAEALLGYTRILAPMDGIITVRTAETGDTINPGTPIFQMVDYQIWAASWIDESKIFLLKVGQKARIRLRSGQTYQGEVVRLNRQADTVTRELEVDVKFDRLPKPITIGEETEVYIDAGRQDALAVPLSALTERNGAKGVFVAAGGRANFCPATLGLYDGRRVAVLKGLKEGEMVIVNSAGIRPGERVRPEIIAGKDD
ncbi:MAG: efflux RND transporter periplasmic adaptor subunit [Syntrophobacteraceae bacterium]|nr:efflux RND transporter periplasmic adaptor subunit [Syntrophobacteraceae bacterium]